MTKKTAFSLPSIISIVAGIGTFATGAGGGLVLAIIAIVAGALGIILSLSPSVRGGIISFLGIGAGLIGIVAAVFKLVF